MAPSDAAQHAEQRIADLLRARGRSDLALVRHLQRAGRDAEANDLLCAQLSAGDRREAPSHDYAKLLERAAEFAARKGRSARERFELTRELARAGDNLAVANVPQHFAKLFEILGTASPLHDWQALPQDMEPMARLQAATRSSRACRRWRRSACCRQRSRQWNS
jgi:hypothetical protein